MMGVGMRTGGEWGKDCGWYDCDVYSKFGRNEE